MIKKNNGLLMFSKGYNTNTYSPEMITHTWLLKKITAMKCTE